MIVALEGADACGKGTHAALLSKRMSARLWKFPNKETPTGQAIYAHLFEQWSAQLADEGLGSRDVFRETLLDALVFQSLQLANRMEAATDIFQAAAKGNVVFDRYWPSAYAYGRADGLRGDWLINVHRWLPQPDLFLLLDIDPEQSTQRRPERRDRYERCEGLMETVLGYYRELWASHASEARWVVINARGTVEETAALINAAVAQQREVP